MGDAPAPPFEQLDFLYTPTRDVASDLAYFTGVLGGRAMFEIPHGPCCSFRTPSGHRIALYQLTRPEVAEHFAGRFDF